ncbi:MAG: 50S ribosomal protein L17 [Candidatus Omnitrophica bacterium]|nr:50S ribosomal protein L17 [Candidatus Omnitrophota bacterium]
MRHRKRTRKLDRTTSERKALLKALVMGLLERQRIITTLAKAKEARKLAEKIITLGKRGGLSAIRRAARILQDRSLVKELISEIAPRFKNRQGGYTRIIKLPNRRKGDNAPLVILELTEQKIVAPKVKRPKKEKRPEIVPETEKPATKEEKPSKEKEAPKPPKEEKHSPREEKKHHIEKPKKGGFFQGIQRFLKPKTGTGS